MLWPSVSIYGPLVKPTRISFPSFHVQAPLLAGHPANEVGSAKTTAFFAPWGVGGLVAVPADGSAASAALPVTVKTAIQVLNMRIVFMVSGFILKAVVGF